MPDSWVDDRGFGACKTKTCVSVRQSLSGNPCSHERHRVWKHQDAAGAKAMDLAGRAAERNTSIDSLPRLIRDTEPTLGRLDNAVLDLFETNQSRKESARSCRLELESARHVKCDVERGAIRG